MADPQLFPLEIEVEMDKGKAVLTGAVPTEEEKARVAEIAGKVEGVEAVVNKLNVTPALRDKAGQKARRDALPTSFGTVCRAAKR